MRVRDALQNGTTFAAEDTRVFKELLNHLGISIQGKKIMAFHDQSETIQVDRLLDHTNSEDLYVTSDAGSPIVSDPAWPLVSRAIERGIKIESYSGVSSPIMALELSGLPPMPFHFHGFLAREVGKKKTLFSELEHGTHIFFEAPTRIEETLDILSEVGQELKVAVVRELSKKFEEVLRFRAHEWRELKTGATFRGEFVLLVHQEQKKNVLGAEIQELAQEVLNKGSTPKLVAKLIAQILDRPSKDIYAELSIQKPKVE